MKAARYILLLVLTVMILAGMFWARSQAQDQVCTSVKIEIVNDDSTVFVTERGIADELQSHNVQLKGKPLWQINTDQVEQLLERSEYLEDVDCITGHDGRVLIRARQLVPVMRVFDGADSYYVNRRGKRMSATATFHTDVPVVQGHFSPAFPPTRIIPLIEYVQADPMLSAFATMYSFRDTNNIYLVPNIQGHVVNLGKAEGFEGKLQKLLSFYRKVMPVKGWNYYDTISVKWAYQVVATRANKATRVQQLYDPNEDEPEIDIETMTSTADNRSLVAEQSARMHRQRGGDASTAPVKPAKSEAKPKTKPQEKPQATADTKPKNKEKASKQTSTTQDQQKKKKK